ncbi:MAG: acyl carrier protein [Caldimonas sp.]
MTTTLERLREILVKDYRLDPEKLTLEAPLEGLGIDSLGVAELLFNVEDEFAITLPAEPVLLPTIGDVVHYIDALVAAQHGEVASAQQGAGAAEIASADAPSSADPRPPHS